MTYVWLGGNKDRKHGWYIVENWISEEEIYKHGPFEKFEDALSFAKKKKLDVSHCESSD
jgi:hypothetical protein